MPSQPFTRARVALPLSLLTCACGVSALLPVLGPIRFANAWELGCVGFAIAMSWWTYRNLNAQLHSLEQAGRLREAETARIIEEDAADQEKANQEAHGQGADIAKACALLDQAAAVIRQNADQTKQANALAGETRESADRGVRELVAIGEAIEALNQSSGKISQILKTIDHIAFQTNILALNAAVEAARAGEAGAGFSVVAEEVRRLAQDAAAAARETTEKIDDAVNWIAQCEMLKTEVISTLNDIATKSRGLAELVSTVSEGSTRETETILQVHSAVTALNRHRPEIFHAQPQPANLGETPYARLE